LAFAEKPEGVGPVEPDCGRVAEEEGRGWGPGPSHDLGRDDFNHGNP